MDIFAVPQIELIGRVIFALLMGLLIGIQRTQTGTEAGMRTYALVSLGAALFIVTGGMVNNTLPVSSYDPLRVAAQVVVGIGFLGAGVIFVHKGTVLGLTTAAGLWVTAGVGMASGFGLYTMAITTTILTLFTLEIMLAFERRYLKHKKHDHDISPSKNADKEK